MRYLLDSDCLIDLLNEHPRVLALIPRLAATGAATSIICYGEVYEGILFGARRDQHEAGLSDLVRWVSVLGLDEETMRVFARLRGSLRAKGKPLADFDLLIAATAIRHDRALVTRNARHFERISELVVSDLRIG
jgi:predicted nucleic acid-binding protein